MSSTIEFSSRRIYDSSHCQLRERLLFLIFFSFSSCFVSQQRDKRQRSLIKFIITLWAMNALLKASFVWFQMSLGARWLARTTSSILFASPVRGSRSSARLLVEQNTSPCNVRSHGAYKRKVSTASLIYILTFFVKLYHNYFS